MTTTSLYPTQDAYTTTQYPTLPFQNATVLKSGTTYTPGGRGSSTHYVHRAYVEFDLSSIPSNAVIYSATLKMTRTAANVGSFNWQVKRITQSWTASSLTANNQPTHSGLTADLVTKVPATVGLSENFDVKNMVERMVYGSASNDGWCIRVSNEGAVATTGASFYSQESSQNVWPKLEVKWFVPISVTNVDVTHESGASQSDGEISFSISGGASSSYTYSWTNSSGTVISTSSSATDLSYGWYGVHVTGTYGEDLYQAFLVGQDCAEVDIDFQPDKNFTENAELYDRVVGITDYGDYNYGEKIYFRAANINSSGWYSLKGLLKFNLWVDSGLDITQADMTLSGWYHYGSSNSARLKYVSSDWNEDFVTYNSQPTSNTSITEIIPATTSSAQNSVVDLGDFWSDWQTTPTNNRGVLLEIQYPNSGSNKQQLYHSPTSSTTSKHPKIEFSVSLLHEDDPLYCNPGLTPYVELKKKMDAGYAIAYNGEAKFTYQEEYEVDAAEYLVINLYDEDHGDPIATCNRIGTTTGGMTAFKYDVDDNRYELDMSGITGIIDGDYYFLEVITAKGDKRYLKILYQD